jgi:hypothetical protein
VSNATTAPYVRELLRRITPTLELAEIAAVTARIYDSLEYENDPDSILDEIFKLWGTHELKLSFAHRGELRRFLSAYEELLPVASAGSPWWTTWSRSRSSTGWPHSGLRSK